MAEISIMKELNYFQSNSTQTYIKQTCSWKVQVYLNMYDLLVDTWR